MTVTPFQICAVAASLLLACGSAVAGEALFRGEAHPQRAAAATIRHLVNDPAAASVRIVRANPGAISTSTRELDLDLGLRHVTVVRDAAAISPLGSTIWSGQIRDSNKTRPNTGREVRRDERNSAMLVRRGGGVTGSVRVDGRLYRLQPLPGGDHAIVEIDETRMPPEHPADFDKLMAQSRASLTVPASSPARQDGRETIRVQVMATRQAVQAYGGDMQALAELSVAETNQGYANSGIDIAMELAHYAVTEHAETSQRADLDSFRGMADGRMDNVHSLRDQYGADLNVLLVADNAACGLASDVEVGEQHAFALVNYRCAAGYYSFAHELGHLQGAMHNRAAHQNRAYAHGHGHIDPLKKFRTIMSYSCGVACPRLNYWSTPDKTYDGRPLGSSAVEDNRRVLELTKASIAHYRDAGDGGNRLPLARFSVTAHGRALTFTDMSSDPDGTVESRRWDFGDGAVSADLHPRHAYAKAGSYPVQLTVVDNRGATQTTTRRIQVSGDDRLHAQDVAGSRGSEQHWTLDVPATAKRLKFAMAGASGDADLYVRFGEKPTATEYDCRPFVTGSNEVCDIGVVRAGTWHVMVRGYADFAGLAVSGSYTDEPPVNSYRNGTDASLIDAPATNGRSAPNLSVESVIAVADRTGKAGRHSRVEVAIVHTYIGDLIVDLIAPDGSTYNLHNRAGGSSDNLGRVYTVDLSDEALNGVWKLRVLDTASGDTGYINHWSLTF